jgi:hypothetical protein
MRRRWKRRLLWAAVLFGVLLLAIPATVAQATAAVELNLRRTAMRVRGQAPA